MDHSQRLAAKIALEVLAADGFILAGGQALIEHGITERLSDDIDLFALHRRHTPATFTASKVQRRSDDPVCVFRARRDPEGGGAQRNFRDPDTGLAKE